MKLYFADALTHRAGAYDLLARAVRETRGLSPLPEIQRAEGGKPYFPHHPHLHFNLSHSGPYALCALSSAPVGVDIQIVKDSWNPRLPARVCSGEQLAWLERQPDRLRAFTLLWAMKESRAKYTGTGLRHDIRGIAVPLPESGETLCQIDGLWFRLFSGADYEAAVCAAEIPPEERNS